MFLESDKQFLIRIARTVIEAAVSQSPMPAFSRCSPSLMKLSGAFVTLRIGNDLRGCIGYIDAVRPLIDTVKEVAVKSALEDPRFNPLAVEELPSIEIEISVISPMQSIGSIDEIEIGKHGLLIELGNYRGLLLPQVAVEYGWDRETFLSQTARKAGLPSGGWKNPAAKIWTFTAEIFSEHSLST